MVDLLQALGLEVSCRGLTVQLAEGSVAEDVAR